MSGDVPCPHCGAFCQTRSSLKRHQKTSRSCRIAQEVAEFGPQGFTMVSYSWTRWNSDEMKRDRLEPPVLTKAKELGIQWFDAPRDRWYAFVETWFFRAFHEWPYPLMAAAPGADARPRFDRVVTEAREDSQRMAVLKMRVATGTLDRYVTSAQLRVGPTEQS